jgi:hypothetical protein
MDWNDVVDMTRTSKYARNIQRTLADLMFDAAAAHIAQNTDARSRSEQIELNRAKLNERAGA